MAATFEALFTKFSSLPTSLSICATDSTKAETETFCEIYKG